MTNSEIYQLAGAILTSIGGASAVLFGLSSLLGKFYLQKEKSKLDKLVNKYNLELEKQKITYQRYSESQFKTYSEIWSALCEVERVCENLWQQARDRDVRMLGTTIKNARAQVASNALFFEELDFKQLNNLFDDFDNFQYGKYKLVELRRESRSYNEVEDIRNLIDENKQTRDRYLTILEKIKNDFRSQIRGERL